MDKVYCPWCNSEMESLELAHRYTHICLGCGASSPIKHTKEDAVAAAMRRPLQKPLTLEEAMDGKEPGVCVEHKVPHCIYYAFVSDSEFEDMCNIESIGRSTPCIARIADYGKEWRCWATKPTEEEREAAKWE